MKRIVVLLVLAVMLMAMGVSEAHAFEPTEGLQWEQGVALRTKDFEIPQLRTEFSWRYYFWSADGTQIGTPKSVPPRDEFDLRTQYRLVDDSNWGLYEIYLGVGAVTHQDAVDRLRLAVEVGGTWFERLRLSVGHANDLNVGRANPNGAGHLGIEQWWVSPAVKLTNWADIYGHYFFRSNASDSVARVDERRALRGDIGIRFYERVLPHTVTTLTPYVEFGDRGVSRFGVYPAIRYNFGDHLDARSLKGLSLELGGNISDAIHRRSDNNAYFRLIWEFR